MVPENYCYYHFYVILNERMYFIYKYVRSCVCVCVCVCVCLPSHNDPDHGPVQRHVQSAFIIPPCWHSLSQAAT